MSDKEEFDWEEHCRDSADFFMALIIIIIVLHAIYFYVTL